MSSPAKKRKTNNHHNSNEQTRGLDFFFKKQRDATKPQVAKAPQVPGPVEGGGDTKAYQNVLTDEEIARQLQEQFDKEEQERQTGVVAGPKEEKNEAAVGLSHGDAKEEDDDDGLKTIPEDGLKTIPEDVSKTMLPIFPSRQKPNTLALQSTASDEDVITSNIPFDESPFTFDPQKYIPELKQHWASDGGLATYALLTRCFVLVNATTSRIKIVDTLVNLLRTLIEGDSESLIPAVWLTTNAISPPYIDLELGLGGSAISKALKKVCGLDNAGLKAIYNKHGDPGDVAYEAKKKQSFTLRKPKPLTIKNVYDSLVKIANSKGTGSQEVKQRIVDRLLQDARGAEESRYIVRTLVQHLRIGAVKTTMLIALSRAFLLSKTATAMYETKSQVELAKLKKEELVEVWHKAEETVKASFARRPNYNDLVAALLEIGVCDELLLRCGLTLHVPLRPMLGSITRDLSEMLTKLQGRDFSCEFKYDGQRAQVHCDKNGKVTIFSRHLELMTEKYPDLVALVPQIRGEGVSSFILEGEVVAIDKETGDLKPFQTLTNRAKKDVVIHEVKVNVCLFAFDLMYLNGEALLDRSFRERRNLLRSLFVEIPHHFTWVKSLDATSADADTVLDFFKQATDVKCEGIMVKVLDNDLNAGQIAIELDPIAENPKATPKKGKRGANSKPRTESADTAAQEKDKGTRRKALLSTYEPDKRLESWLKVKKDYNTSADTLDLIPIAGWHGQGRKAKWWSPILLAVRNPESGTLVAVTKCISGFTDDFYKANRTKYDPDTNTNVINKPSYIEYSAGNPDVWFEPQEVWEMVFADVTLSPTYTAAIGLVSEERGLSLRFPRFLKVREDKSIEEASTDEFLADLYRTQEARAPGAGQGQVQGVEDED
jgi:DNA ligase-1